MRRSTLSLITAATIGLLALGAAPAHAEPGSLPEGDALFGIACPYYSTEPGMLPPMQLIWLDPADAVGTLVGSGTVIGDTDCAGQGAWNAANGKAYAVANGTNDVLVEIDPVYGGSTVIGNLAEGSDPVAIWAIAIDADGNAFAMGEDFFYSLDLVTAQLTQIGEAHEVTGMSFDPSTGLLYSVDSSGDVYLVDPTDGSWEDAGSLPVSEVYSFAIDSAGIFWFVQDDYVGELGNYEGILWSVDPADLTESGEESGLISVGDARVYPMSLLVVPDYVPAPPAPQLAATGLSVDATALGVAAVLGLVGVGILVARRRAA